MTAPTHAVTVRIAFDEGAQEREVLKARMMTYSEEDQQNLAATLVAFLISGAESVTATDHAERVIYHEDRRDLNGKPWPVPALPDSVN
jgi:hypothetical protein